MGFIEETGAAQFMRDARINTIYEGTTGIQANDLLGRKIARDGGATLKALVGLMQQTQAELAKAADADSVAVAFALERGIDSLTKAAEFIVANMGKDVCRVVAGAVPFLHLMGNVCGGWMMAKATLAAQAKIKAGDSDPFYVAKIRTARYYADHAMTEVAGYAQEVIAGGASTLALDEALF
jgi:hypothetical protein